jgi:hypothetical protein
MTKNPEKTTVGVTERGAAHLAEVIASGWFSEEIDAYRVAISVALKRGIATPPADMTGVKTKFNTGSLDGDGSLGHVLEAFGLPEGDSKYSYAQRLADAGLAYLAQNLTTEGQPLASVLGLTGEAEMPAVPASTEDATT